jgi:uncharacterized protein YbbC (DUF1343 family)
LAPEHGWSGYGPDATPIPDGLEPNLGLPIYSLYGLKRRPPAALLEAAELVIVDLQDVGVRCYTYAATLALLLEAAAETGTRVLLCDRPNPLGRTVRGPNLDLTYRSFLGYLDVPYCHGLTLGELAENYNNRALQGRAHLDIVPVPERNEARPWLPPSPGLPTQAALELYPGLVLLEGTNLSEGRGTPFVFTVVGAPWLDSYALAEQLRHDLREPLWCKPITFVPESGKYVGNACRGVHFVPLGPIDPLACVYSLLCAVRQQHPEFSWRLASEIRWGFEGHAEGPHFEPTDGFLVDYLLGTAALRHAVDTALSYASLASEWQAARERL